MFIKLSYLKKHEATDTCAPQSSGTQCETRDHEIWPESQWLSLTDAHLSFLLADPADQPWRTPEKIHVMVLRFKLSLIVMIIFNQIHLCIMLTAFEKMAFWEIVSQMFYLRQTSVHSVPYCTVLYCTLVCPNLYWLWSISREPNSFSAPFLLSMNCPSGIAAGFRMRYLHWPYLQWSTSQL